MKKKKNGSIHACHTEVTILMNGKNQQFKNIFFNFFFNIMMKNIDSPSPT